MLSQIIRLFNKAEFHMIEAKAIVEIAGKYKSEIMLEVNRIRVNAKSLLGIMSIGFSCGMEIKLICDGKDEKEAITELTKYFESGCL